MRKPFSCGQAEEDSECGVFKSYIVDGGSPYLTRDVTANDPVRRAWTEKGVPGACTNHGSRLVVSEPAPFRFRMIERLISNRLPSGSHFPNLGHVHRSAPPSSTGPIPADSLPRFRHPLLPARDLPNQRHSFRGNPPQISQSCGTSTTLRNASHILLHPPSRFSHPSISSPYLDPFKHHYLSSRQSAWRFLPSQGATST